MKVKIVADGCWHNLRKGTLIELLKKHEFKKNTWWTHNGIFVLESDITPVTAEIPESPDFAVACTNEDEWNCVEKKAQSEGHKWASGQPHVAFHSTGYGPSSVIYPKGSASINGMCYGNRGRCTYRVISAAEYLGTKTAEATPVAVPTEKFVPKVTVFGNTPIYLDYPIYLKVPEKIDANHCPICRCDKRCEGHAKDCLAGPIRNEIQNIPEAIKPISGKPNGKAYDKWFKDLTGKLMN